LSLVVPDAGQSAPLHAEAWRYYAWAALSPLLMVVPFQMDGVFIGATRGGALRNSMIGACALFVLGVLFLVPIMGNHGLWLSFGWFMIGRGVFLALAWRGFAKLTNTPAAT
ncbi:MAG: MATE family efflux transporter, partial [Pseudomonadota bacterium]